jgi:hypothetical protein
MKRRGRRKREGEVKSRNRTVDEEEDAMRSNWRAGVGDRNKNKSKNSALGEGANV